MSLDIRWQESAKRLPSFLVCLSLVINKAAQWGFLLSAALALGFRFILVCHFLAPISIGVFKQAVQLLTGCYSDHYTLTTQQSCTKDSQAVLGHGCKDWARNPRQNKEDEHLTY